YETPNSIQDLQDLIDNGIWNTSILNKDIEDEKFNYIFGKNVDEKPSPLYKEIMSVSDSLLTYWDIRNIIIEAADTNKNTENKSLRQLIDANVNLAKELNEHAKEQYNERVRADSIDGIYIPVNLTDACQELDKMFDNETKEDIIRLGKDFRSEAHHTLGMWIRNNWGLWGGSRLQAYLRDKGYSDPDEMSDYLLTCYQFWLESKAKSDE
ncbi:MAG: hypothetical protein K2J06_04305, partial [Muribaculaceae bacterium]|nr:hypothetical protein [Muribaculaceae bacterium]